MDKILCVKNISGGPLPAHNPPCDPDDVLKRQPATSAVRGAGDTPAVHKLAFCPGCVIPAYDSVDYPFEKDEEVFLPEYVARGLERQQQWKGKLKIIGNAVQLAQVLMTPDAIYEKRPDGRMVPRGIRMSEPKKDVLEKELDNPRGGRVVAKVEG